MGTTGQAKKIRLLLEGVMFLLGGTLAVNQRLALMRIQQTLERYEVDHILEPAIEELTQAQEAREKIHDDLEELYLILQAAGWEPPAD